MPYIQQPAYRFANYVLLPADKQLLRDGTPVPLTPKVFDTLLLLVEAQGRLVSKEEFFTNLWPDSYVEEVVLAHNISRLRHALANGNGHGAPKLIETVPKRGYRFMEPVIRIDPEETAGNKEQHAPTTGFRTMEEAGSAAIGCHPAAEVRAARGGRMPLAVTSVAALILLSVLILLDVQASSVPHIAMTRQITHSGRIDPWGRPVTDGSHIYFLERHGDRWESMRVPVAGGAPEPVRFSIPGVNVRVLDVSPDASELLVATFVAREENMPLWRVATASGRATRVGDVDAVDASFTRDGMDIVYSRDHGIWTAHKDGSSIKRLATVPGVAQWFAWAPDGAALRFSVLDTNYLLSLWQLNRDGSHLHPVFSDSSQSRSEGLGQWTADGKYYLFSSTRSGNFDIWASRDRGVALLPLSQAPLQATNGPQPYDGVVLSRDGTHAFAPVAQSKTQLARYDARLRQWRPFLNPTDAAQLNFSRDGKWVVFVDAVNGLWRARADGREATVVSSGDMHVSMPRVSSDGSRVLFLDVGTTRAYGTCVLFDGVFRAAALPECDQVDWAPDSQRIVWSSVAAQSAPHTGGIFITDLRSGRAEVVPGSAGLRMPRWSPDGRFLLAQKQPFDHRYDLMIYDFREQRWHGLLSVSYPVNPEWSSDGRFVYVQDLLESGEPILRVAVAGGRIDRVAEFTNVVENGVTRAMFLGLAPGDVPVASLQQNLADLYELQLKLP